MMMSEQLRLSILPGMVTDPLTAPYVAQDYSTTGEIITEMGVHWYDPLSPGLNGSPFTATLIYGSLSRGSTFCGTYGITCLSAIQTIDDF